MTLTELKYIVTLAQERHFRRAAERCFVSQPTLSVAIKKLEDELDVTIFERNRSDVRVTMAGERIVSQARKVLEEAELVKQIALEGKGQINLPLRVGAIFTVGPYLFPHLIRNIKPIAPEMPLILEENYTGVLRQKLRNGELDAIIISLPFEEPDVEIQDLYDEPFEVLIPAEHPLAKQEKVTRKQLEKENILMLGEGHCFRDQVLNACPGILKHSDETSLPQGTSLETLRHMVASGLGITILPSSSSDKHIYDSDTLVERPFAGKTPYRRVSLVWRKRFSRPKAIAALVQAITSCALQGAASV
ncbi:MAG: LysR family transcriptional regulator [Pseudomonadales bacterium]|jgi:LysR family transcriptional regulator, hydrogen peroxide-inducible genes activator|uniref:hydrogen peroxide-inducible genes activator n=1 Tax=unclassified Ketobacter TaxID=2639109 RepID=UPI000C64CA5D|nr:MULTISPECIES: hydrogen peroxide-inducible genes activator [unclassified Ketobacter]MAA58752.1 LysR family transcriptional regulator [Pseudomonadales bacterium]MEC8812373.1 LysR substrate-binding domain-containing protein [Pseudomonadota bacterium]TNC84740.1 MAG: LysR family transcriptional regulator [Alcanivorax sp.]HAG92573.1 LysR family transcriptional regulator [Gammaproteobacteria bacterium]MAQ27423.1 LysR family transcriptional regulator [Pseudomonadales bacterium]|tara:strand:+ start:2373 stop:3284 length:912 start_codon:yes stop_codon:yes gene_type:complete